MTLPMGDWISPRFAQWPHFEEDEIEAVTAILRLGQVNRWTGTQNLAFEEAFARYTNTTHAIAVANGTLALELILAARGIGPGDEVIVPCRTFIASASCVVMRGATPVIVDINRDSQNLTTETIEPAITDRTRAIICVHLNGWPCDMQPIRKLAEQHNLFLIEDCAQCHGARYHGDPVGSLGDAAAFSFCQDKIMTTGGEGGLVVTRDEDLWSRMWAYKDHGKDHDTVFHAEHPPGFRWLHASFGTNWRMTEMQAAIGIKQLAKLSDWVATRQHLAGILNDALAQVTALRVTLPPPGIEHAYYRYYAFVRPDQLKADWSRDRIIDTITRHGVPCYQGICWNIMAEKAFDCAGRAGSEFVTAKELGDTGLMFKLHPTLTDADIEQAAGIIIDVMREASR